MKDALSLVKELTEENERLNSSCTELTQKCASLTEENEGLQKALNTDISIVRVSRGSGKTAHLREVGRIKVDAIRADTVRKMQERLKEHLEKPEFPWDSFTVAEEVIDQIAKEMLEENNV
jgi:formylmethanofuran:tetrahydromethanopterin formyltransferase